MKAVVYARVSTSHHGQNPEVQLDDLRRYCAARGWGIAKEILDHGYSGATDARPGLRELLDLVRQRKVDVVIVSKMDRLFRSLRHLVTVLEEFQALGVKFVATQDHIDYTTPAGRLMVQVLASLAEFERSLIRERTRLGLEHARRKGVQLGRPAKHDPRAILRLWREGLSQRKIAAMLSAPLGSVTRVIARERKTHLKAR